MLGLIKEGLPKAPQKWTKMGKALRGLPLGLPGPPCQEPADLSSSLSSPCCHLAQRQAAQLILCCCLLATVRHLVKLQAALFSLLVHSAPPPPPLSTVNRASCDATSCAGVSEETTTGVKRLYEMQVPPLPPGLCSPCSPQPGLTTNLPAPAWIPGAGICCQNGPQLELEFCPSSASRAASLVPTGWLCPPSPKAASHRRQAFQCTAF